jgi:hypothetical protein
VAVLLIVFSIEQWLHRLGSHRQPAAAAASSPALGGDHLSIYPVDCIAGGNAAEHVAHQLALLVLAHLLVS